MFPEVQSEAYFHKVLYRDDNRSDQKNPYLPASPLSAPKTSSEILYNHSVSGFRSADVRPVPANPLPPLSKKARFLSASYDAYLPILSGGLPSRSYSAVYTRNDGHPSEIPAPDGQFHLPHMMSENNKVPLLSEHSVVLSTAGTFLFADCSGECKQPFHRGHP